MLVTVPTALLVVSAVTWLAVVAMCVRFIFNLGFRVQEGIPVSGEDDKNNNSCVEALAAVDVWIENEFLGKASGKRESAIVQKRSLERQEKEEETIQKLVNCGLLQRLRQIEDRGVKVWEKVPKCPPVRSPTKYSKEKHQ